MNNSTLFLRGLIFSFILLSSLYSHSQFVQFNIETVEEHSGLVGTVDLTGQVTYRVYAETVSDDDYFSALLGSNECPLTISTTTSFFQTDFGSVTGENINPDLYSVLPEVEYDSWITIGKESNNDPGGAINIISGNTTWVEDFENGGSILINDETGGGWFGLGQEVNQLSGDDFQILLGQFTTDGELVFEGGTIQIFSSLLGGEAASECTIDIEGCMDETACNYLDYATIDSGDCCFGICGCTDTTACNFDEAAECNDESCAYEECAGCTDVSACNYDETAVLDSGDCCFGICGCTDTLACNYDELANCDNASCNYETCFGCTDDTACNYDPDAILDSSDCCYSECVTIEMFDSFGDGWNGTTYEVYSDDSGDLVAAGSLDEAQSGDQSFMGIDVLCLPGGCYNLLFIGVDFGSEISVNLIGGICGPSSVNGSDFDLSSTSIHFDLGGACTDPGCTDPDACNYNLVACFDDGSCTYDCGCVDELACNYDPEATEDSGNCCYGICGCLDSTACNYDDTAECDDFSCSYETCSGCTDDGSLVDSPFPGYAACNYDPVALIDDGSCEYIPCQGCNDDGNFADSPFPGQAACNYNPEALIPSGTCDYTCSGCTDQGACNYDDFVIIDNGTCCFEECLFIELTTNAFSSEILWNLYDSDGNLNTSGDGYGGVVGCTTSGCFEFEMFDTFGDGWNGIVYTISSSDGTVISTGEIETADVGDGFTYGVDFFVFPDTAVPCYLEGCVDELACNFNPDATILDESCEYISCVGCTDDGNQPDSPFPGYEACNYNPEATIDDDICIYTCLGCTDELACNYSEFSTVDNGTCCLNGCAYLNVGGGLFDYEISWQIFELSTELVVGSGENGSTMVCLDPDLCYVIEMYDSFGDGWSGATYELILDGEVLATGSIDEAMFGDGEVFGQDLIVGETESCISGCADDGSMMTSPFPGQEACNYDPDVDFLDNSCLYESCLGCTDENATNFDSSAQINDGSCVFCQLGESIMIVDMNDSFGDGWNGAVYSITSSDGTLVAFGSLDQAMAGDQITTGTDYLCLDPDCYSFNVTSGAFPNEISWAISDQFGSDLGSIGNNYAAPIEVFGINFGNFGTCDISGCLDETCHNYNPSATADDGSCICPPENNEICNATSMICGDEFIGTIYNSSDAEELIGISCGEPITSSGVWYSFSPEETQSIIISLCESLGGDLKLNVFEAEGCSDDLNCIGGNDTSCGFLPEITVIAEEGMTYFIYVSEFGGGTNADYDFNIQLSCTDCDNAAINDEVENAISLESEVSYFASVCCSNPSTDYSCNTTTETIYDQWFTMNSGECDDFLIELISLSGESLGITIYEEDSFGELEQVGCCGPFSDSCVDYLSNVYVIDPWTNYFFQVWTEAPNFCGDYELNVTCGIFGCMDYWSVSYYDLANLMDESCIYIDPPSNDLCEDAIELNCGDEIQGSNGGSTMSAPEGTENCQETPNHGVWYKLSGTGDLHTISTCGSLINTEINVYSLPQGSPCDLEEMSCVISQEDTGTDGCGLFEPFDVWVEFESDIAHDYYVYISNYDDGDPFSEGWGLFNLNFSCQSIVAGCLHPAACNYNPEANIEAACDFFSCTCDGDEGEAFLLNLTDEFGDGWATAELTLTNLNSGEILFAGNIEDAEYFGDTDDIAGNDVALEKLCLADGCYSVEVSFEALASEVGASLEDELGNILFELVGEEGNSTSTQAFFSIGNGICGCTDVSACNYDADATLDDQSCCFNNCYELSFSDLSNDEVYWSIVDLVTDELVDQGYAQNQSICLEPTSCYGFEMGDFGGDGWEGTTYSLSFNGEVLFTGSLESSMEGDGLSFGLDYFILNPDVCNAGCIDSNATNYDENAELPDGSCQYTIDGVVFEDTNANGILNNDEFPLPFQVVEIQPTGLLVVTNDEGEFSFAVDEGEYEITLAENLAFPFNSSPNPYFFNATEATEVINLGLYGDVEEFAICTDLYPAVEGYPCNDIVMHSICFRNMGNVPISGYVNLIYDFPFQGHEEITPIDSSTFELGIGQHVYMGYDDLMPGEMFFYEINLLTPTVEFIGEYVSLTTEVYGFYEDQEVASGSSTISQEMTCSYDPNDKQGFPNGYADPHFVNQEEEIEYLVRFQNTGNAMANQVLIVDTLSENLDIESFSLMANSHSVMTTLDPETRIVEFLFENIMLPDSATDQEGSNGLVSYKIRALEGLEAGTEINNTAHIFFDNNPEIITNTTWHTIYECTAALATVDDSPITVCVNEPITWTNSQEYIENYNWLIQDELVGMMSSYTHSFDMPGTYTIDLSVDNPLCEAASSVTVTVLENPALEVSDDQEICLGESATFTASGEGNIIWNDEVEGEDFTVTPTVDETYIVVLTDMNGCSSTSEVSIVVNELPSPDFIVSENNTLTSTITGVSYQWYLNGNPIEGATASTYEVTEDGDYNLEVINDQGCMGVSDVIFVSFVSISDLVGSSSSISIFPNPLVSETFIQFDCASISQIRLVDSSGKVVRVDIAPSNNGMNLSKGELSSGWYLAEIFCKGKRIGTARLVIE